MQKKDLDKWLEKDGGRSPGRAAGATTELHFVRQSACKTTLHHCTGSQHWYRHRGGARHNNIWTQHWCRVVHSKDSRATLVQTELVLKRLVNIKIGAQHLYIAEFLMDSTADCFEYFFCLEPTPSWRRGRVAWSVGGFTLIWTDWSSIQYMQEILNKDNIAFHNYLVRHLMDMDGWRLSRKPFFQGKNVPTLLILLTFSPCAACSCHIEEVRWRKC